jgi:hypothetical protein
MQQRDLLERARLGCAGLGVAVHVSGVGCSQHQCAGVVCRQGQALGTGHGHMGSAQLFELRQAFGHSRLEGFGAGISGCQQNHTASLDASRAMQVQRTARLEGEIFGRRGLFDEFVEHRVGRGGQLAGQDDQQGVSVDL